MELRSTCALVALALLAACGKNSDDNAAQQPAPAQVACTMIGCSDGLRVVIDGNRPARFTVQVSAEGRELRTVECTADAACDVFIENETPTEVVVRVTSETGGAQESTVAPTYQDAQPNGPDCPPTCRQGTATISL